MLNYFYAILEAETRIALLTVGLDPGMGFLHADQMNRDSLALDLMEPNRPVADQWPGDSLADGHFAKRDFFERRDGTVRVSSRITSVLAEASPYFAREVGLVAEWLAKQVGRSARGKSIKVPTPLSEANRSRGRDSYRTSVPKAEAGPSSPRLKTCPQCGKLFWRSDRRFCSKDCHEIYNMDVIVPKLANAGPRSLTRLREQGKDPNHGGEVGRKRGRSNAKRAQERACWERQHPEFDYKVASIHFRIEVLPALEGVPLSKIMKATGLSRRYASMIRRGIVVPHPMHLEALAALVQGK